MEHSWLCVSSSRAALACSNFFNKWSVKADCTGVESAVLANKSPGQEKTPQLWSRLQLLEPMLCELLALH